MGRPMREGSPRSCPQGLTHADPATRPGVPSARRLSPIPRAWQGWTPCLSGSACLRGLRPPAAGYADFGGPPRKARQPASEAAPRGWTPRPRALRARLARSASPTQVAALRVAGGASPPIHLTAPWGACSAGAPLRWTAPPDPSAARWGGRTSGGCGWTPCPTRPAAPVGRSPDASRCDRATTKWAIRRNGVMSAHLQEDPELASWVLSLAARRRTADDRIAMLHD